MGRKRRNTQIQTFFIKNVNEKEKGGWKKQTMMQEPTDIHLGFMMNNENIQIITPDVMNTFMQSVRRYRNVQHDIEITHDIKKRILDAVMANISLDVVAREIAEAMQIHEKHIAKLHACNVPQGRVIVQKTDRAVPETPPLQKTYSHGRVLVKKTDRERTALETPPLQNAYYEAYLRKQMRFRNKKY